MGEKLKFLLQKHGFYAKIVTTKINFFKIFEFKLF